MKESRNYPPRERKKEKKQKDREGVGTWGKAGKGQTIKTGGSGSRKIQLSGSICKKGS